MNILYPEELQEANMSVMRPVYPAQIVVSQAELKLVADETDNANTQTIKSDQQRVTAAQEIETAEANTSSVTSSVDFVA
jgi:hypothetical protein